MVKAGKCSFLRPLTPIMSEPVKWQPGWLYAARGVIFPLRCGLIGAPRHEKRRGRGMNKRSTCFRALLYAVAAGLMLFGRFSLVQARYRRIHHPPPAQAIKQKVADKLTQIFSAALGRPKE